MQPDSSRLPRRPLPVKKVLLSLLVLAAFAGVGTFSSFTAQTTNPSNTFGDGTLVLSNTKQGGVACLSTGGGTTDSNVNGGCDQLLNLATRKPGDSGSANLTIKNEGTLASSIFKLFASACVASDVAGETYHGTGNPCSVLDIYVQQWSDSGFSVPSVCLYGGGTATTCAFDDTKTLSTFQAAYNSSSNGRDINSGVLSAGASTYFTVAVKLPTTAGNTYQGRKAVLDFSWFAQQ